MTRISRRLIALSVAAGLGAASLIGPAGAQAGSSRPSPGAPGVGDRIFPLLGNGGYDVGHYSLNLRYDASLRHVLARVTLQARASAALSRFNLDYGAEPLTSLRVDGLPASWDRVGDELTVVPRRPIAAATRFTVSATYRTGPRPYRVGALLPSWPWFLTRSGGSVVAAQPNQAHRVFPSNDHPSDKATFDFTITAPAGALVVANGALTQRRRQGQSVIWRYHMAQPMATELVQIAVGREFVAERSPSVAGVVIRSVYPRAQAAELRPLFGPTGSHLRWMQRRVGQYPFGQYGILEADQDFGFALETQGLSLFSSGFVPENPADFQPIAIHELSHQWFGNSVAPVTWSDVWQSEGHATWYQIEYVAQQQSLPLAAIYRDIYQRAATELRRRWGPVALPRVHSGHDLFNDNVYIGGALVLFALRQRVGDATFRRIERAWVQRYRGRSVGTLDFIRLASQVSGRDLHPFLRSWLYEVALPPMPGHPQWRPTSGAAAVGAATALARARSVLR